MSDGRSEPLSALASLQHAATAITDTVKVAFSAARCCLTNILAGSQEARSTPSPPTSGDFDIHTYAADVDIEESMQCEDEQDELSNAIFAAVDQPFVSPTEQVMQYLNDEEIAASLMEAVDDRLINFEKF